jgi:hypothetical protein
MRMSEATPMAAVAIIRGTIRIRRWITKTESTSRWNGSILTDCFPFDFWTARFVTAEQLKAQPSKPAAEGALGLAGVENEK